MFEHRLNQRFYKNDLSTKPLKWTLAIVLFLMLFFRGGIFFSATLENQGVIFYQQSLLHFGNNDLLHKAENHFVRAQNINPLNQSTSRWIGFTLASLGLENDAISVWRVADKEIYEELIFIGNQKRNANRFEDAILWYDRAIHLDPNKGDPWYYKGLAYEKLSRYEESINSLLTGLNQPQLSKIGQSNFYFRLGWILNQKQEEPDWAEILAWYENALDSNSFSDNWTLMQTHFARGEILSRLDRKDEAIQEFEFVVANDPTHYASRVQLGLLLWELNHNTERAEHLFLEAVKINQESKWAYRGLATLYQGTNKPELAIQMYQVVVTLDPQDTFAVSQLHILEESN